MLTPELELMTHVVDCDVDDLSWLRDFHNDFHGGLAATFLELILGAREVETVAELNLFWS